jgi:hypothetical protein
MSGVNGGMSEEEALMLAIQMSMQEEQNIKIDPKSQGASGKVFFFF